ncbi:MAG: protein kinase [Polyangia bacterium]
MKDLDRKLMTGGGGIIGTPTYMAPERLRQGSYDGRSDVYSVGVMMYLMLSGRLPFTSDKESYVEIVLGHLNQPVPPLVGGIDPIPGFFTQVVMRTLEKDPSLRPTARELLNDLVRVARYGLDAGGFWAMWQCRAVANRRRAAPPAKRSMPNGRASLHPATAKQSRAHRRRLCHRPPPLCSVGPSRKIHRQRLPTSEPRTSVGPARTQANVDRALPD